MEDWMLDVVEDLKGREDEGLDSSEIFKAIANSSECSIVWTALKKRLGIAAALHEKSILSIGGLSVEGIGRERLDRMVQKNMKGAAVGLVDAIWSSLIPQQFCESATVVQRRKLQLRFSKAVDSMSADLKVLADEEGYFYNTHNVLQDLAQTECHLACEALANSTGRDPPFLLDDNARAVAEFVAIQCLLNTVKILETIEKGVTAWADTPPMILKPEATNAARLRLIRGLTGYFKWIYGQPLRSSVLALTGVFFDCDGLDESTISKLAP